MATALYGHTPAVTYTQLLYKEPAPAANTPNIRQDDGVGGQINSPLDLTTPASMVNYLSLVGSATGNAVALFVKGTDANPSLTIDAKGSGTITLGSVSTGAVTLTPAATLGSTLAFSTAAARILPGATSISLRNNANNADNLIVTDAGLVNLRNKIFPGTDAAASQSACGLYAGTGAPNNANGANGDVYFRADGGALTFIYQRRAGVWTALV